MSHTSFFCPEDSNERKLWMRSRIMLLNVIRTLFAVFYARNCFLYPKEPTDISALENHCSAFSELVHNLQPFTGDSRNKLTISFFHVTDDILKIVLPVLKALAMNTEVSDFSSATSSLTTSFHELTQLITTPTSVRLLIILNLHKKVLDIGVLIPQIYGFTTHCAIFGSLMLLPLACFAPLSRGKKKKNQVGPTLSDQVFYRFCLLTYKLVTIQIKTYFRSVAPRNCCCTEYNKECPVSSVSLLQFYERIGLEK